MQKRMLGALVGITLLVILCMNVLAAYTDGTSASSQKTAQSDMKTIANTDAEMRGALAEFSPTGLFLLEPNAVPDYFSVSAVTFPSQKATGHHLSVNGRSIGANAITKQVNGSTYISLRTIVEALDATAVVSWKDGQFSATGQGFTLSAKPGDLYLVVNDRYLYVPNGILHENNATLAPVRTVCNALGASAAWEAMTGNILITTTGSPLESGSQYYNQDDLHWMSRVISAESKNQPLKGKIAVGTVVMNRVESPKFPDSIHGVIFQDNQFQPVDNGSIHLQPTPESVIAAKLILDGAREAGTSLFFNRADLNGWTSRAKTHVVTIADHSFYS